MSTGRDARDGGGEAAGEEAAEEDTVACCPGCGAVNVRFQARRHRDGPGRWKCYDCGDTFDELAERPPRPANVVGTPGRDRLCDRLARADPEDVTADDGGGA